MQVAIDDLPEVSRTELEAVSIHLNPVLHAIIASPEAHRSGHAAVLCRSIISRVASDERGAVIAYLQRVVRSDLN